MDTEKEDRARDKYYQRTYGITLARYNEMLESSDGCCWACGWKPTEDQNRLAVDHLHYKIICTREDHGGLGMLYVAQAPELSLLKVSHKFKKHAIAGLKQRVKHLSVRGLVCWRCNGTIKRSDDNWGRLDGCAKYLYQYDQKRLSNFNIDKPS